MCASQTHLVIKLANSSNIACVSVIRRIVCPATLAVLVALNMPTLRAQLSLVEADETGLSLVKKKSHTYCVSRMCVEKRPNIQMAQNPV